MEHMDTYVVIKRYTVESDSAEDALRTVVEAPIPADGVYVQRVEDGSDVEVTLLVTLPEEDADDPQTTELPKAAQPYVERADTDLPSHPNA